MGSKGVMIVLVVRYLPTYLDGFIKCGRGVDGGVEWRVEGERLGNTYGGMDCAGNCPG